MKLTYSSHFPIVFSYVSIDCNWFDTLNAKDFLKYIKNIFLIYVKSNCQRYVKIPPNLLIRYY